MSLTKSMELESRPEARVESVESLLKRLRDGGLRVPFFQRGLRWDFSDVRALLDSIRRGLPIGSLLIWKKSAPAEKVKIGPLLIDAPKRSDAWYIVDGQQRLTSLAGSLMRDLPLSYPSDPYVVYFDPVKEEFCQPERDGSVSDEWVPLPYLLDASNLSEFIIEWPFGTNKELRQTVFECGKRLREYQVPLYLVETDNADVLKDIFYRVNNSGKSLRWDEVYDALHQSEGDDRDTIATLCQEIVQLGWGKISKKTMPTLLLAMRGRDVTRSLGEHLKDDRDVLKGAVEEARTVFPRAIDFLRFEAHIPHERLLPRGYLLELALRFFALHPTPKARSLVLLRRAVWRFILGTPPLGKTLRPSETTLRRHLLHAIDLLEEESIQRILTLAPKHIEQFFYEEEHFDARSAVSRTAMLLLATMNPRHLETGEELDIAAVIDANGDTPFPNLIAGPTYPGITRAIHPRQARLPSLVSRALANEPIGFEILETHCVGHDARVALREGNNRRFAVMRTEDVAARASFAGESLAEWHAPDGDRPTLEYILSQVEDDDGI